MDCVVENQSDFHQRVNWLVRSNSNKPIIVTVTTNGNVRRLFSRLFLFLLERRYDTSFLREILEFAPLGL